MRHELQAALERLELPDHNFAENGDEKNMPTQTDISLNTILYGLGAADGTCFHSFRYLTRQTLKKKKSSESYIVITPDDKGDVRACIQELSNAVGAPVCVLKGCEGVEQV